MDAGEMKLTVSGQPSFPRSVCKSHERQLFLFVRENIQHPRVYYGTRAL